MTDAAPIYIQMPGDTPVPSPTTTKETAATGDSRSIIRNLHPGTMGKPSISVDGDIVQRKGKRRHDDTAMPDDKGEGKKAKISKPVRSSLWMRRRAGADSSSHLEIGIPEHKGRICMVPSCCGSSCDGTIHERSFLFPLLSDDEDGHVGFEGSGSSSRHPRSRELEKPKKA